MFFFFIFRLVEIADKKLIIVKNIEFIIFCLNIQNRKMKNTFINVEYVFDLDYYMIFIDLLNRKKCFLFIKKKANHY